MMRSVALRAAILAVLWLGASAHNCPKGKYYYTQGETDKCGKCASGRYGSGCNGCGDVDKKSECPNQCIAGRSSGTQKSECTDCGNNKWSHAGAGSCTSCVDGKYTAEDQSTSAAACTSKPTSTPTSTPTSEPTLAPTTPTLAPTLAPTYNTECTPHIDEDLTKAYLNQSVATNNLYAKPWYVISMQAETSRVRFAWFGCPDGFELKGALQAYCVGGEVGQTTVTSTEWTYSGATPYCSKCRAGYERAPQVLLNINVYRTPQGFEQYREMDKADFEEGSQTGPPQQHVLLKEGPLYNRRDQRAICTACPAGSHTHDRGAIECWECPKEGVTCSDGVMKVKEGWWYESAKGKRKVESDTKMQECAGAGFCKIGSDGASAVECAKGYEGALCGGCNYKEERYMPDGEKCSRCWAQWITILVSSGIFVALVVVLVYVLGFHNLNLKVGDHSVVYQKLILSNLQMIGALGMFKARGTAQFNTIVSRPAAAAGGSVSGAFFVKCIYGSAVYLPFVINMASPIVAIMLSAIIMLPVTAVCRCRRKKLREQVLGDPPTLKWPIITKLSPFFLQYPPPVFFTKCSKKMTERDTATWSMLKRMERKRYLAGVRLRKVIVFLIFALYPSLVAGVMTVFNCVEIEKNTWYLASDLTSRCYDTWHFTFLGMAVAGCVVYCIGIPLALSLLLLCKMEEVHDTSDEDVTEGDGAIVDGGVDGGDAPDTKKKKGGCCRPVPKETSSTKKGHKKAHVDRGDDDAANSDSSSGSSYSSYDSSDSSDSSTGDSDDSDDAEGKVEPGGESDDDTDNDTDDDTDGDTDGESDSESDGESEAVTVGHPTPDWTRKWHDKHTAYYWQHTDADGQGTHKSQWTEPTSEETAAQNTLAGKDTAVTKDAAVTVGHPTKDWTRHWHDDHAANYWQHTDADGQGTHESQWTEPTSEETAVQNTLAGKDAAVPPADDSEFHAPGEVRELQRPTSLSSGKEIHATGHV